MKYIFITGGVVSSLGKGLTAGALGALLEVRGLQIKIQKFDPYLNVDPGTMSPFQHGEVYVLDDGSETDLDLGHYERFTSSILDKMNNLTSGQIYEKVIKKERRGDYLGKTVQVIPHITDEIKNHLHLVDKKIDIVITEIGGTIGDIEGLPFLEAMRQFTLDIGKQNVLFIHTTLIPFIKASKELKSKPTQQSIAKLREIGIQADIIICRTEKSIPNNIKKKISLFCNVPKENVIQEKDVDVSIYELPIVLHEEKLDEIVVNHFNIKAHKKSIKEWNDIVFKIKNPKKQINIGIIGKYIKLKDSYLSVYEAIKHAGIANNCKVNCIQIDSSLIKKKNIFKKLAKIDGILIPGGFGNRGIEGKILTAQYARENKIPYFGLCLGLQIAIIEYARHILNLYKANSAEFDPETLYPVIDIMKDQKLLINKGGNMRLGKQPCLIAKNSLASKAYNKKLIYERHRHRYEFNNKYHDQFLKKGLLFTGINPEKELTEIIEIKDHPWFLAVQFHPEFQSKPNKPHPLFTRFIEATIKYTLNR